MLSDFVREQKVHVAMKGLIVSDGKFLFLKQKVVDNFFWDLPGGRIIYGESPEECLRREIFEETKLNVKIIKPIGVWSFFRNSDKDQVVCFVFLCNKESGDVRTDGNPDTTEITESCHWFNKEEFLQSTEVMNDEGLKKFIAELEL